MRRIRTDLAMEASGLQRGSALPGVRTTQHQYGCLQEMTVEVLDARGEAAVGKPCGRYVTLSCDRLSQVEPEMRDKLVDRVAQVLTGMLPPTGDVLVIGLGNRRITADSLGPRVVDGILVTRHMREQTPDFLRGRLRAVSAVSPGVLGVTGLETAEVVRGLVEHVKPTAVIAVDALAARETHRICTTLQIADTGIHPGSGVGNHRMGLNQETLGVPVIAMGVPMVVYAATIARDALELLVADLEVEGEHHEEALGGTTIGRHGGNAARSG
ncbi:MAG: GPR endopeptidase [Clostridia bacterium]